MIQCGDGGNMIQCDACNQCFHDVCIKTNTRVWESVWLFMNLNPIVCSINIFITSYYISCRTCFPNLTRYIYQRYYS